MSTITRERVAQFINNPLNNGLTRGEQMELARIALAALEAEPAGFIARHKETGKFGSYLHPKADWFKNDDYEVLKAYTAPPAPASVPDEATPENIEILASTFAPRGVTYQWDRDECNAATDSWNACRAAMLQGAEPVSQREELTDGFNFDRFNDLVWLQAVASNPHMHSLTTSTIAMVALELNRKLAAGNSPVIPDGWVMVPVDMSPEQMRAVQINSELGDYTAANLSGAYSLFREFWDVAVAAAPQQEVKNG